MRLALTLVRGLIRLAFVAAVMLLLLRAALEYPHPPKWDTVWFIPELHRIDPAISEFGDWTGLNWKAGSGMKTPLILAAALLFLGAIVNGWLHRLVGLLPERRRPPPAVPATPQPIVAAEQTSVTVTGGQTGSDLSSGAPDPATAPWAAARIGRYEIQEEIGRGAMGVVYRALDPQIDRIVAIKTVRVPDSKAEAEIYKKRFVVEVQSAGRLSHPGIVAVYDFAEDAGGQPCLVMEFVEGRTLEQLVKEIDLPQEQAIDVMGQIARALDYAHGKGVIHRDIKPANIIVTPAGKAKLGDFGIAKLAGTDVTVTGQVMGTPAFMSPEQVTEGTVDARSDIFSMGSVLYWLVTGDKPFTGDTIAKVTYRIVHETPLLPTILNPTVPADLNRIILRCLAKNPGERYANAGELAAELEALRPAASGAGAT